MSLASLSIRRPVTILMFNVGIVLLAVVAYQNLPVDFLPSIKIPRLTVTVTYPGSSPEETEAAVTQPVELALGTVLGAKKVSSVSREGMAIINLEFYWGTNIDFAMLEVREKLDQVRGILPREAGRPTILRIDPSAEPIMTIVVSQLAHASQFQAAGLNAEGMREGLVELKETARALLKRRLEQIEGIAQVEVLGGLEREILVEVDSKKMNALGITLEQISSALASANLNLPGGTIKRGLFRYSLRTVGEFSSVGDINSVVVTQAPLGRPITIRDIAVVNDTFQERTGLTRFNRREIIVLNLRKEAGSNTIEVSKKVHEVLNQLRKEYPTLELNVIVDHAEFIGKSISDVQQAIVIGAVLAFLVLFFFLKRPKYPVIIGLVMPISILATLIAMYFLGISLNIISLTGLALGIGMLGDNAIIVVENVTRLRERGLSLREAAVQGAEEINLAVTASTLTNVAIFLPIIFVQGVASQLFVDMGVTMTISLLVSLLVAATLVPMLVSRETTFSWERIRRSAGGTLEEVAQQKGLQIFLQWFSTSFRLTVRSIAALIVAIHDAVAALLARISPRFYSVVDLFGSRTAGEVERFLDWALKNRWKVLGGTSLLFGICVFIAFFIPAEPAPDIDQTRFRIRVEMPKGTTLDGTSEFVKRLEDHLSSMEGVAGIYSNIGITEETNLWTISDAAIERANLEIKVSASSSTNDMVDAVRMYLAGIRPSFSNVEFSLKKRGTTFEQILRPEENDLKIRITGPDAAAAVRISDAFAKELPQVRGLVDLKTSLQRGSPEYRIVVDRDKAARYGLSVQQVGEYIAGQVRGKEATDLSDFDRKITIRVRPLSNNREAIQNLLNSSIQADSLLVPLRELIQWEQTEGYAEIWRENHQRAVIITANVSGRSLASVVEDIDDLKQRFPLPAQYTISVGGENEEVQESFRSLFLILLLSLFLVYMILAAEYESVLYPFVILLTSPLAFIGAILAMALSGQNYNVMSMIGLAIMIGAVDNDAVIVVDVITALRREGMELKAAIREGIRRRLRPILMTTATTILGIIPLVFEFGTGSELVRALAVPLVGGLIASTFFTVTAIPVVYSLIDSWAMARKT